MEEKKVFLIEYVTEYIKEHMEQITQKDLFDMNPGIYYNITCRTLCLDQPNKEEIIKVIIHRITAIEESKSD